MEIAREEIFGPLVGIQSARDAAHALELANSTEYGLSSTVFTRDISKGVAFAQGIRAGMTHVNDMPVNDEPNAPFGGEKNSGLGRFNGDWAIEEFTTDHWITVQHAPRDRKSTRLNSSHVRISYAVFCLKKKKKRLTT